MTLALHSSVIGRMAYLGDFLEHSKSRTSMYLNQWDLNCSSRLSNTHCSRMLYMIRLLGVMCCSCMLSWPGTMGQNLPLRMHYWSLVLSEQMEHSVVRIRGWNLTFSVKISCIIEYLGRSILACMSS